MSDDIQLRLALDDAGRPYLHDQHGRTLAGVRDLSVVADLNNVVSVSVTFICYHEGAPVVMGADAYRKYVVGDNGQVVGVTTTGDI